MASAWRLITDGPVDGALNMALDRAAQLAREEGSVPPTLRLYSWSRPTITLGRFQPADTVDLQACDSEGIDVARRFTGGRGVLHDDEVTYAVIASVDDGVPRGVAKSYRHLCAALARAYRELGVGDAALIDHDRVSSSAACYLASTRADLSSGARKLSGSAQVWAGATVLQHGSFTRTRDVGRDARAFRLNEHEAARLEAETVTLSDALDRLPTAREVVDVVVHAFAAELDLTLVPGEWTAREAELATALLDVVRVA